MLSIIQVRNDLLSKLAYDDPTLAPAGALQDVVIAMNGAMQMLQTAGQDYFTRETLALAFTAGTSMYALSQSVQTIIGPARWNNNPVVGAGRPLSALNSRGELDQFDRIFLGVSNYGTDLGDPLAYWVENIRKGTTGDINQINIYLAPLPRVAGTLTVDVVNDAPNYSVSDFIPGTAILPVAQNYTESIFLPIARLLVSRSSYFSRPDTLASLQADYDHAVATLANSGGFPNAVQSAPKREVSG